jgi:hypothetical protein
MKRLAAAAIISAFAISGCRTGYSWRSGVPDEMRTVAVPTFRNESDMTELGSLAAQQLLREFQREGTFRIARPDDAAVEVQGVVKDVDVSFGGGNRKTGMRIGDYWLTASVEVSVVDRLKGRVLVDNRQYKAEAPFASQLDISTAMRNAGGRLADDLARQVVDDVLAVQW